MSGDEVLVNKAALLELLSLASYTSSHGLHHNDAESLSIIRDCGRSTLERFKELDPNNYRRFENCI